MILHSTAFRAGPIFERVVKSVSLIKDLLYRLHNVKKLYPFLGLNSCVYYVMVVSISPAWADGLYKINRAGIGPNTYFSGPGR